MLNNADTLATLDNTSDDPSDTANKILKTLNPNKVKLILKPNDFSL
jgi:hypothetical protein